jgi:nuclear pore complex protein Nup133
VFLNEVDSTLLSSRFRPEQRARFSRDLNQENTTLSQYVEQGELEFWFKNFLSSIVKVTSHPVGHEQPFQPVGNSDARDDRSYQTARYLKGL